MEDPNSLGLNSLLGEGANRSQSESFAVSDSGVTDSPKLDMSDSHESEPVTESPKLDMSDSHESEPLTEHLTDSMQHTDQGTASASVASLQSKKS